MASNSTLTDAVTASSILGRVSPSTWTSSSATSAAPQTPYYEPTIREALRSCLHHDLGWFAVWYPPAIFGQTVDDNGVIMGPFEERESAIAAYVLKTEAHNRSQADETTA